MRGLKFKTRRLLQGLHSAVYSFANRSELTVQVQVLGHEHTLASMRAIEYQGQIVRDHKKIAFSTNQHKTRR